VFGIGEQGVARTPVRGWFIVRRQASDPTRAEG